MQSPKVIKCEGTREKQRSTETMLYVHSKRRNTAPTNPRAALALAPTRDAPLAAPVVDEGVDADALAVVPFSCLASEVKAVKFFAPESTALMANTMP